MRLATVQFREMQQKSKNMINYINSQDVKF